MRVVQRGKFNTVVWEDGTTITVTLQGIVSKPPRDVDGKTYVSVFLDDASEDLIVVEQVDAVVRRHQPHLEYSPLTDGHLVLKIGSKALADPDLAVFDDVEIHASLGNFGSFGYCWIATNIFRAYPKCTTTSSSEADRQASR